MATKERRGGKRGDDRRTKERQPARDATAPARNGAGLERDSGARRRVSATIQHPTAADTGDRRREEIAQAAYYKAEKRGFKGHREMEDWLEAEKEVDSQAARGVHHEAAGLGESTAGATAPAVKEAGKRADAELIDPEDLQRWAKKLEVPAPRLREAIQRVGSRLSEVKLFLESRQPGG